jgi:hypothetical protein
MAKKKATPAKAKKIPAKKSAAKSQTKTKATATAAKQAAEAENYSDLYARIHQEVIDGVDEELEMELEDLSEERPSADQSERAAFRRHYFKELHRLQIELVRLQDWVSKTKHVSLA